MAVEDWSYQYTNSNPGWEQYGGRQTHNANMCMKHFLRERRNTHMSKQAACAIIGNFQHESYLNPGQCELGYPMDGNYGFGLGQWTPATKIWDDYDYPERCDGDVQIDYLLNHPGQWSTVFVNMSTGYSSYYDVTVPILPTIDDFYRSHENVQTLAVAWAVYWERPGAANLAEAARREYAQHWFDTLNWFPIWLICNESQKWRMR